MSDETLEEKFPCIGVCMADPETGLCQGCGRPLTEPDPDIHNDALAPKTVEPATETLS